MVAPADAEPSAAPAADDPARRRLGWVGLAVAVASFFTGVFVASLLGGAYGLARGLDEEQAKHDFGFAAISSAGLWVGFLALPLLWARAASRGGPNGTTAGARRWRPGTGEPGRAAGFLGLAARWVDVPLGLAVGLASTLVTGVASSVLLTKGQQDDLESKASDVIDRAQGPAAVVLLVLLLCVATPIAEEVFFRGLLFGSMRRIARGAGVLGAVVLAGLIFGLVHYDFKPAPTQVLLVQISMLSLFGMALCTLAHRTGRLGAGMVAHATFNAVTVVSLLARR